MRSDCRPAQGFRETDLSKLNAFDLVVTGDSRSALATIVLDGTVSLAETDGLLSVVPGTDQTGPWEPTTFCGRRDAEDRQLSAASTRDDENRAGMQVIDPGY